MSECAGPVRAAAVSTLAAQHPELASLIQVSQAMRDQILHRWPETRVLPAARGNRIHGS